MDNLVSEVNRTKIIEGVLFVSGDGIEKNYLAEKLGMDLKEIDKSIIELKKKYNEESGIQLITYNNKIQFCSNPEIADEISTVLNPIREKVLTKAALETLAIIAYKQPITRLEIEEVRGVSSDYAIQILTSHKLIDVVGVKDVVGKPFLFGTTDNFLKRFQIESLESLPDYEELLAQLKGMKEEVTDSLYNEFKLPDEEEISEEKVDDGDLQKQLEDEENKMKELEDFLSEKEIPDFLKDEENIQIIE